MRLLFASILMLALQGAWAQEKELTGAVIGSKYSVNYGDNTPSVTENTKEMVFDNDVNTFFASYDRSFTWVGLDLGTKHVITKVAFSPRRWWSNRMVLGVFEGANNPDFGDAVPLHIVKTAPDDGVMTTADVNVSRGFRYVRYVGPDNVRCNVSEIKFYGTEGEGDDSQFYTPTALPVVCIHTEGAQDITSKEEYLKGIVNIIPSGGKSIFSDSLNVRGRGNASWSFPKKPYRMKLYNKARLLGMPAKAKNWTLINNYGDKTLIRNCLAFQMSRCLEMEYTPACTLVDVMLNGEYRGTYQLCDKIDINKNRVNITEMKPEDVKTPEVTGGYMIEIDGYAYQEKSMFVSSNYNIPVTIHEPGEKDIVKEQSDYIKNFFNRMTQRVWSAAYNSPSLGYHTVLDKPSFLKHFIVGELSCNTDTYHSVYMYKERGEDKLYTGPVWDFDLGFENDNRIYPTSTLNDFLYRTKGTCSGGMRDFANRIINSSRTELKYIWSRARYDRGLTLEDFQHSVDSLTDLVGESQVLNFMRWPILNQTVHQNYQALGSYEAEVGTIRKFLEYRFPWMDKKLGLVPVGIDDAVEAHATVQTSDKGISVTTPGGRASVTVYDMSGVAVANAEVEAGSTSLALQPGVYVVKIDENGTTSRRKVLVK